FALPSARLASTTRSFRRCTRISSTAAVTPSASPSTRKRCNRRSPRNSTRVSSSPATTMALGGEVTSSLTVLEPDRDRFPPPRWQDGSDKGLFRLAFRLSCPSRAREGGPGGFSTSWPARFALAPIGHARGLQKPVEGVVVLGRRGAQELPRAFAQ